MKWTVSDQLTPLHSVKLYCINNALANYKSLLNTSTNVRV